MEQQDHEPEPTIPLPIDRIVPAAPAGSYRPDERWPGAGQSGPPRRAVYGANPYSPSPYPPHAYPLGPYVPHPYPPGLSVPHLYAPDLGAPHLYAPDLAAPHLYAPDLAVPHLYAPHPYAVSNPAAIAYPVTNPYAGYLVPVDPRQQAYWMQLYRAQKSRVGAGLLAILIGPLGIHNFYLGRVGIGLLQLLLTVLSFGILVPLVWLWTLIEGILILTRSPSFAADRRGIPLRD